MYFTDTIVPNDIFAGETLLFKAHLIRAGIRLEEICVSAEIEVSAPVTAAPQI